MKYKPIKGSDLSRAIRNSILALGAVAALGFGAAYMRDNYEESSRGYSRREVSTEISQMYSDVKGIDTRQVQGYEIMHLNGIEDILEKDPTLQKAADEQQYLHSKYDSLKRKIDQKQDQAFYSLVEDLDKSLNRRGRVRNIHALQREYENACRIDESLDALEGRARIPKDDFKSYQQLAETNKEAWENEPYHVRIRQSSSSGEVSFRGIYNHDSFSGARDIWERAKENPAFPYAMAGLGLFLLYRLLRERK